MNGRSLVAYWILGLCNNYGYVVMLTAASDIIGDEGDNSAVRQNCKYMSTGIILLADVIPALIIKLAAPFIPFMVHLRIAICVSLATIGFIAVALARSISISILGVICTSLCSGLGEVTLLQYSSFYKKNVVSAWSSGTGGSGIIGAMSYATLLQPLGIQTTMLVMLIIPTMTSFSFWLILPKPSHTDTTLSLDIQQQVNKDELENPKQTFINKIKFMPSLLKYMLPFGLVYLFEYYINQGTFEIIQVKNSSISNESQYRWFQVVYQLGVFISRSSVNCFQIKKIWILTCLQGINVILFTTEAIFYYIPNFYIVLALVLWEGMLGGAAYVNTYYRISTEVSPEKKQFSMAITGFADSIGITLAGLLAIVGHNAICNIPVPN